MASVLELARHANVPAAQVLRVLNGKPVSMDVGTRVRAAILELGHPNGNGSDALANGNGAPPALHPSPLRGTVVEHGQPEPDAVGSIVYEALRVEVRPVAEHVSQVGTLVDQLVARMELLGSDTELQRRERVEDLALLTELITSGWRSVDRRLGRLERMVERLSEGSNGAHARRPIGGP